MPEPNQRTYVQGMRQAVRDFDELVTERLVLESEAEETAKALERLERSTKETLREARRRGS